MCRMNFPYIRYFVTIFNFRFFYYVLKRMLTYEPIYQFICLLTIDKYILCNRDWLVLTRISISGKSPATTGRPSSSFWLDPNDVINKLKPFLNKQPMEIKGYRYSM